MRTIKFRGKRQFSNEWVFGYFKKNAHGDCYIEDEDGLTVLVDPDTVSQMVYSDNKGYEIYEGDYLLDIEDAIWLVVYDDKSHGFLTHTDGLLEYSEWIEDPAVCVLGNKWDNSLEDLSTRIEENKED